MQQVLYNPCLQTLNIVGEFSEASLYTSQEEKYLSLVRSLHNFCLVLHLFYSERERGTKCTEEIFWKLG